MKSLNNAIIWIIWVSYFSNFKIMTYGDIEFLKVN